MTPGEFYEHAVNYFNTRYELIQDISFAEEQPEPMRDHTDESSRKCRFCGRGPGETTFEVDAHAVPVFLGNRRFLSLNECDSCNSFFGIGGGYEDHLSKWSGFARALAQLPKKKGGSPTFKSKDLRVESLGEALHISPPRPGSVDDFLKDGVPTEIEIEGDTSSQPHIPIRAAKALVKIACSICPLDELSQCRRAINWLMDGKKTRFAPFPVMLAVTPGVSGDVLNGVKLLRRKEKGADPYLWCIVRFRHFQLQAFVPFCPADDEWCKEDQPSECTLCYFPSPFGPDWPRGRTVYSQGDWSGETPVRTTVKATIQIDRMISITRPGGETEFFPPPSGQTG